MLEVTKIQIDGLRDLVKGMRELGNITEEEETELFDELTDKSLANAVKETIEMQGQNIIELANTIKIILQVSKACQDLTEVK